jgi:hypothetical protein
VAVDRGYRAVLRDRVAGRLLAAQVLSQAGDFVGLAALLVLAYRGTGSALATAAVLAVRVVPSVLTSTVFGPWLDRWDRRLMLVSLGLGGAIAVSGVAIRPTFPIALVGAAFLGARRIGHVGVEAAVLREAVHADLRRPQLALSGMLNQLAQLLGLVAGGSVTIAVGSRAGLVLDAVTFLLSAAVYAGLPGGKPVSQRARPKPLDGLRFVWRHATLWPLALVTWSGLLPGAIAETLAPKAAAGSWLPAVLAAFPAAAALSAAIVGRTSLLDRTRLLLVAPVSEGVLLVAGGVAVAANARPIVVLAVNAAAGAASIWVIGVQAAFARICPVGIAGHVNAVMVSSVQLLEGAGALLAGFLANRFGLGEAYLLPGTVVVAAWLAVTGYLRARQSAALVAETGS